MRFRNTCPDLIFAILDSKRKNLLAIIKERVDSITDNSEKNFQCWDDFFGYIDIPAPRIPKRKNWNCIW